MKLIAVLLAGLICVGNAWAKPFIADSNGSLAITQATKCFRTTTDRAKFAYLAYSNNLFLNSLQISLRECRTGRPKGIKYWSILGGGEKGWLGTFRVNKIGDYYLVVIGTASDWRIVSKEAYQIKRR